MPPQVLLIAAVAAGLWYGGKAAARETGKAAHAIGRALKHPGKTETDAGSGR